MDVTDLPLWENHPWEGKMKPNIEFRKGKTSEGHEIAAKVEYNERGEVKYHIAFDPNSRPYPPFSPDVK